MTVLYFYILLPNSSPSKHISCRLDRIYVSQSISSRLLSADIESYVISDHYPVSVVLKCIDKHSERDSVPTSLHWKCNSTVLADECFQDDFKCLWSQLDSVDNKSSDWWDLCKSNFRCLIIAHSQRITSVTSTRVFCAASKSDPGTHYPSERETWQRGHSSPHLRLARAAIMD